LFNESQSEVILKLLRWFETLTINILIKIKAMKRTKNLLLLLFLSLFLVECQKTDDGSYVAPLTIYAKLAGNWKLSGIKVVDEIAKASSIKPDEVDLISKFTFSSLTMTFNVDADSLPTSFEVGGTAPDLFLKSGYWDLDSPFTHTDGTPVQIFLYSDAAKTQLADVLYFSSLIEAKKSTTCEIKLTRLSAGTPYVSYTYKLTQPN
jgi:hypothetical protein